MTEMTIDRQARHLPARRPDVVKPTRVTNDIRRLRFEHDEMTQANLAERIGVTRQTVIAIEQGRYSPSLEMAFRIATRVRRAARGRPATRCSCASPPPG